MLGDAVPPQTACGHQHHHDCTTLASSTSLTQLWLSTGGQCTSGACFNHCMHYILLLLADVEACQLFPCSTNGGPVTCGDISAALGGGNNSQGRTCTCDNTATQFYANETAGCVGEHLLEACAAYVLFVTPRTDYCACLAIVTDVHDVHLAGAVFVHVAWSLPSGALYGRLTCRVASAIASNWQLSSSERT